MDFQHFDQKMCKFPSFKRIGVWISIILITTRGCLNTRLWFYSQKQSVDL